VVELVVVDLNLKRDDLVDRIFCF